MGSIRFLREDAWNGRAIARAFKRGVSKGCGIQGEKRLRGCVRIVYIIWKFFSPWEGGWLRLEQAVEGGAGLERNFLLLGIITRGWSVRVRARGGSG